MQEACGRVSSVWFRRIHTEKGGHRYWHFATALAHPARASGREDSGRGARGGDRMPWNRLQLRGFALAVEGVRSRRKQGPGIRMLWISDQLVGRCALHDASGVKKT